MHPLPFSPSGEGQLIYSERSSPPARPAREARSPALFLGHSRALSLSRNRQGGALDRLTNAAHHVLLEGKGYRPRQRPDAQERAGPSERGALG